MKQLEVVSRILLKMVIKKIEYKLKIQFKLSNLALILSTYYKNNIVKFVKNSFNMKAQLLKTL